MQTLCTTLQSHAQISHALLNFLPADAQPKPVNKTNLSTKEILSILSYSENYITAPLRNELDSVINIGLKLKATDSEKTELLFAITNYYDGIGNYSTALNYCTKLLQGIQHKKAYQNEIAIYRMIKGGLYARLGDHEESIRYFMACLDSSRIAKDSIGVALVYSGMATPYSLLGLYPDALKSLDSSTLYFKADHTNKYSSQLEDVLSSKCRRYLNLYESTGNNTYGKMAQQLIMESKHRKVNDQLFAIHAVALEYCNTNFSKAILLSDSLLKNIARTNPPHKLYSINYINRYKGLSLLKIGKSEEGKKILKNLVQQFTNSGKGNLPISYLWLSPITEKLYEQYKKENNAKEALFYLESFKKYSDLANIVNKRGRVFEVEQQYNYEKKDAEIKNLEAGNIIHSKEKNLAIALTIISLLCALSIAIILYNRLRKLNLIRQIAEKESMLKLNKLQVASSMQIALLEEKNSKVTLEQQHKLGMELHDNLAANIAFIKSKLQCEILNTSDDERRKNLMELSLSVSGIYETVRNKSHQLYNTKIEDASASFKKKIIDLLAIGLPANKYEQKIIIDDECLNNVCLQTKIEMLYIIQEAVANIIKYANARKISILIYEDIGGIMMHIKDDGIGIKLPLKNEGLGLGLIKKRAADIDGSVEIKSDHTGTEIIVTVGNALAA